MARQRIADRSFTIVYVSDTAWQGLLDLAHAAQRPYRTRPAFINAFHTRFTQLNLPGPEAEYWAAVEKPRIRAVLMEPRYTRRIRLEPRTIAYLARLSKALRLNPERPTIHARAGLALEFIGLGWIK